MVNGRRDPGIPGPVSSENPDTKQGRSLHLVIPPVSQVRHSTNACPGKKACRGIASPYSRGYAGWHAVNAQSKTARLRQKKPLPKCPRAKTTQGLSFLVPDLTSEYFPRKTNFPRSWNFLLLLLKTTYTFHSMPVQPLEMAPS